MLDFTCQAKVIGKADAALRRASVAVVGVGGTGCNAALLLGQLGVRNVKLIDPDVVEKCNLSRQPLFSVHDVGKLKAEVAVTKLSVQFPSSRFKPVVQLLNEKNSAKILRDADVVLDCTDNYDARVAINRFCRATKIPWVYSAAMRNRAMVSTFVPGEPCFECFAKKPEKEISCSEEGIIATSTSLAACVQIQELINLLSGAPQLAGKILHVNLSNLSFEFFPLEFRCSKCAAHK